MELNLAMTLFFKGAQGYRASNGRLMYKTWFQMNALPQSG